jgi:ABC-type uncharacterized transport system substrate-binding protein
MPLQRETRSVPIVFAQVADPVAAGFIANLARPDGNVTEFTQFEYAIGAKWLELLKQIAPQVTRVRCSLTHLVTSASTLNSGMSISPRSRCLLQHC